MSPPLLHHAKHKHQWPLHGAMPCCRSQGMPLDGRSGLICMRKSMCALCSLPVSPLLHRCCLQNSCFCVWVGLCRGLMWGEPSGLGESLSGYLGRAGSALPRPAVLVFHCFTSGCPLDSTYLKQLGGEGGGAPRIEAASPRSMLAGPSWHTVPLSVLMLICHPFSLLAVSLQL